MSLLEILLVIFLPPVAVFMNRGVGKDLVINIILILFFWLPAVIHAAWVVSNSTSRAPRV